MSAAHGEPPSPDDAAPRALPWNTAPTGLGSAECGWCGRTIYAPAVPCSVAPIAGLEHIATAPGQGDRCKWEAETRVAG